MRSLRSFLAVALLAVTCVSSPAPNKRNIAEGRAIAEILEARSIENGIALRILPLGDSITWGSSSSHGNGYRGYLFDQLLGNGVEYIGSQRSGNMLNNQNEGHPGALIDDITGYAGNSIKERPNVVLVMAGTNDVDRNTDIQGAPDRLGRLLDKVIAVCPDAVVLVAKITPVKNKPEVAARQSTFNAAVPGIVASRVNSGAKALVVDMSTLKETELADDLHPNDIGYLTMARIWFAGLEQAGGKGWITEPITVEPTPGGGGAACSTYLYWEGRGTIATGVGGEDAPFVAGWQPVGILATGHIGVEVFLFWMGAGVRLADMNGDGRDDYLWLHPVTGATLLCINGGYTAGSGINWICKGQIASGVGPAKDILFADINGDGRDDYLLVADNGDVTAWINGGEQVGGQWLWTPIGRIVTGSDTGGRGTTTRFADIDGDGRADYLLVAPGGALTAWRNGGYSDRPEWQSIGVIATGVGGEIPGVFLHDLNGDGRADYVQLDANGAALAFINTRGGSRGMTPDWLSVGQIATGVGILRDEIIFGDLNGDGKKDYVRVNKLEGALEVWLNTGTGASYVAGDGTKFGDVDGDGRDDYLSMAPNGALIAYRNGGADSGSPSGWKWENLGTIATGAGARKNVRIADLDGDGKADYLVVDEKSGAVNFWRNGGPGSGGWIWENRGQVATGIGAGVGVQFADIDGDGKADYLWVDTNGAVTAFLNGGSGPNGWIWINQGKIATGVGGFRPDIQFHDIDGDGLADYLWVNPLDGSVTEWRNGGAKSGDFWQWYPQGQIATGVGSNGLSVQFANLNGEGRADYLWVTPPSGAVTQWYNGCFGGTVSDPRWQTVTCTDSGVIDASIDPSQRWGAVYATSAWAAVLVAWRANPGTLDFPRFVSNFFKGPEGMQCSVTAPANGCGGTVQCPNTNYPAGYFILNSLQQINLNFYTAIGNAQGQMTSAMSTFSSAFAPIKDTNIVGKILLDFVGLGFALVASPTWNILFKDDTNLSALKDVVNSGVSNGITLAKDSTLSGSKLDLTNALEVAMGNMVTAWYETIKNINEEMFSGSLSSLPQLTKMMSDGKMLVIDLVPDLDLQKYIMRAVYAYLIPKAWRMSNKNFYPFVLDSKAACGTTNPLPNLIRDKDFAAASICYNEVIYFLVTPKGDPNICEDGPCPSTWFEIPPGMDKLDGKQFGGVTKEDLIICALNGYKANGNQNGWAAADVGKSGTVSDIYETGIRSPGVVQLPVCDAEVSFDNWSDSKTKEPNYPCN